VDGSPTVSGVDLGWSVTRHRSLLGLSAFSLALASVIFAPIGIWPVAFVCLVPWLLSVGGATLAPRVYFHSFVLGLVFFLINMAWLYEATGAGYAALAAYQALYFPLVACPLRHVVRRRRWPLAIALPLVWTGSEMLRAVVMSGFPWFFLSHSLHEVLTLIQVSDVVGAYGVTFMVASVNGALADLFFKAMASKKTARFKEGARKARHSLAFALGLLVFAALYGQVQLHRDTTSEGPRIAVIQGDYINSVYPELMRDHDRSSEAEKMTTYLSMLQAAAVEKPDLYLLPESPWIMFLNPEARDYNPFWRTSFSALQRHATQQNAIVVSGSATAIPTPDSLIAKEHRYNSATVFYPDAREPGRYDKSHLVYFGEAVPFRTGRLRFLYFWLNWLMPFSGANGDFEYSVFRGEAFRRFEMNTQSEQGKTFHFAIPICYEDVMPYVSREFVHGGSDKKRVDFLLNISNDGWFGRGFGNRRTQQWQHLAISVFRAVENRVGIARAVNTGMSGFIHPSGRVERVVSRDDSSAWPGECGFAVSPIHVDSRYTLYSRYGDWFGWGCALLWLLLFMDYWIVRARSRDD